MLKQLQKNIIAEIEKASELDELDKIYKRYLGRNGELTLFFRSLKDLPEEERKIKGRLANEIKEKIKNALEEKSKKLQDSKKEDLTSSTEGKLKKEWFDITAPGEKFKLGGSYSADNLSNANTTNFSLRGYKPAVLKGNNLLLASLEYRFPLANIERSLKVGPLSIFLERLSGALFFDMGNAWESPGTSIWQDFKSSIGAELKADFNSKYDSPFTLKLGAAKALTAPLGYDIYITLGSSF